MLLKVLKIGCLLWHDEGVLLSNYESPKYRAHMDTSRKERVWKYVQRALSPALGVAL